MKKRAWIIGVAAAVVLVAGGAYAVRGMHYQSRFLPDTKVLGVNIGGKTVKTAAVALKKSLANETYSFKENGNTKVTATGKELGLTQSYTKQLQKLIKAQNPWGFSAVVLASSDTAELKQVADDQTFDQYIDTTVQQLNKQRKAPVDAKVVADGDSYKVQKEQAGNEISATKLKAAVSKAVTNDHHTVNLASTYTQPKITSTNKKLQTMATKLTTISKITAQIKIENKTITIPSSKLHEWLSYADGKVTVSESGVAAYVKTLAATYNTYGTSRTFKSTKRGTVTVPGGTYGWSILQTTETSKLVAAIAAGKSFSQEVSYSGSGYNSDGSDIGNTYVEVDKKNQKEYFYKDGKLVLSSDVVTGKPKQATPTGVFYVWSKERNKTLRGKNDDGTSYASKVSYWMPIDYTGVGLHDSPWQPKYGGTWYIEHGSHGCVNNPPSFMAKLYAAVPLGTPVIVF